MTTLATTWQLWMDGARSPAMNMAVDQALLESAPARGCPLVRIYRWDRPACSIGCFQTHAAAPPMTAYVRRPTGGGVVDHRHDLTYTVVLPAAHPICLLDRQESYGKINAAVIEALASLNITAGLTQAEIPDHVDRRRMVCFTNPTRYDVVCNGTKVAGAAQRRCREGILHQGSVLLEQLPGVGWDQLSMALPSSFTRLFGGRPQPYTAEAELLHRAAEMATAQFDHHDWNRKR